MALLPHMERPRRMVNAPFFRTALLGAAAVVLAGCTTITSLPGGHLFEAPAQNRGNLVEEEALRQITTGVSSRSDVVALLGSPTASGTFDDEHWYYIASVTRQRPGRQLALEGQQVVAIRFDGRGTVQEIRRLREDHMRDVAMVARTTPSPGNERTFLQQLFSNIGRVGPGLGQQQGGPGGPSPTGR